MVKINESAHVTKKNIVIVDDSLSYRLILSKLLQKLNVNVYMAENGQQAYDYILNQSIDIVISDWEMPVLNGVDLCQMIRSIEYSHYIYIILVSARTSKEDIVTGLDAGADDFLVKPINEAELVARLNSAYRVIDLEMSLKKKNGDLSIVLQELKNDLYIAQKLQFSLLPTHDFSFHSIYADWMLIPSAFVSGDLLNIFPLDKNHIGFFAIDVSGHGIAAAMYSMSLAREFMLFDSEYCILLSHEDGYVKIMPPSDVVRQLNKYYCSNNMNEDNYFTIIYGVLDTDSGHGKLCQAGHPTPLIIRNNGDAEYIGTGGAPVGLLDFMDYEDTDFSLNSGDRLYIYSDGIIEAQNSELCYFGVESLTNFLENFNSSMSAEKIFFSLKKTLCHWVFGEELDENDSSFIDDVSLLMIQRNG